MVKERDMRRRENFMQKQNREKKKKKNRGNGEKEEKFFTANFVCVARRPSPAYDKYPYGGLYRGYQNMFSFSFKNNLLGITYTGGLIGKKF